jgi:hypothetical protein
MLRASVAFSVFIEVLNIGLPKQAAVLEPEIKTINIGH